VSALEIPRAGVVGWPIAHSRSPLIHNYWLKTHRIAGVYERIAAPPGAFAAFAQSIRDGALVGANVTVPHKEAAFAACDWLSPVAGELGAANTLWREAGKLCGDNSDVVGFLANLDESAPGWRARRATIIGAGGAARAVVAGLRSRGVETITLVNRTHERARRLARQFGDGVEAVSDVVDLSPLPAHALVADLVYVPLRTPLIDAAAALGLRVVDGLGMLLHQAAPGFERWFGVRPSVTAQLRALIEADITGVVR